MLPKFPSMIAQMSIGPRQCRQPADGAFGGRIVLVVSRFRLLIAFPGRCARVATEISPPETVLALRGKASTGSARCRSCSRPTDAMDKMDFAAALEPWLQKVSRSDPDDPCMRIFNW